MCLVEFVVKYVLFIVNLAFSLLGLVIISLGIATLVVIEDLHDILPIQTLGISIIVLGVVVFLVAFLACCGAVRESPCMLICYALVVSVLAGLKIWLTVMIFTGLSHIESTVDDWLNDAFGNPTFQAIELSFRCCGTTGPGAYGSNPLPPSCCNQLEASRCTIEEATPLGCNTRVESWFSSFGGAVGGVLMTVIVVECVAVLFSLFFCNAVRNKRRRNY